MSDCIQRDTLGLKDRLPVAGRLTAGLVCKCLLSRTLKMPVHLLKCLTANLATNWKERIISMKVIFFGLIVFMLCTINGACYPRTTAAASYVPRNATEQPNITDTTMIKRPGATVYLFHGATHEGIQPLAGQDFAVFREPSAGCPTEKRMVGKIRVSKSAGDHHLEAVVTEGELKEGDVAQLGAIYGLVVLTIERCETLKTDESGTKKTN